MAAFKSITAVILLIAVVGVFAGGKKPTEEQKKFHKDCVESSKVDVALFDKAYKGEFVDDANLKQYMLCISRKIGYINDKDEVSIETFKKCFAEKLNDDAKLEELAKKCAVKAEKPEDTAFNTAKCFYQNAPENVKFDVKRFD